MFKNYRDYLALFAGILVFPVLWIIHGLGIVAIPEGVIGATISIETMIFTFYFRKSNTETG